MNSKRSTSCSGCFNHVNVVTMKDETILPNKTVVVQDGRISQIGDAAEVDVPPDCEHIDGRGRFLMPGLVDMHVHLGDNSNDLLLYLVNGVTAVRNMWGLEGFRLRQWLLGKRVFRHLQLRDDINAERVLGPTIYTAGPMVEGEQSFFPRFMVKRVGTAKAAEETVRRQAASGYDLVKFYSTLSRDVFLSLVHCARQLKMPIAGHIPDAVGLRETISAQVSSVEHLLGFFHPYRPDLAIQASEISEVAELSAEKGVFHCPTLIATERLANVDKRECYENDIAMGYLPKRVLRGMRFLQKAASRHYSKKNLKPNHAYLPFLYETTLQLHQHGAQLLLGTDTGAPYVAAGFSAHQEMLHLSNAGLSPYQVLKAATVNPAHCLNQSENVGTVETGKTADLLLVEDNPLVQLNTIQNHQGVMTRGRWLSRQTCDGLLESVRASH